LLVWFLGCAWFSELLRILLVIYKEKKKDTGGLLALGASSGVG